MKKSLITLFILILTLVISGCGNLSIFIKDDQIVTPSDRIITESHEISRVHGVELRTSGKINIHQGDCESLIISGPDNIVPLVKVENHNGILVLGMERGINLLNLAGNQDLTFDIQLKELSSIQVSGLGHVEIPLLTTDTLDILISGSSQIKLNQLQADQVKIDVSGLGNIIINGQSELVTVSISGSGNVMAGDLECKSAQVTLSGLGTATVWATEKLTGNISGSGFVSYFCEPAMTISTNGLGAFKPLGNKQSS